MPIRLILLFIGFTIAFNMALSQDSIPRNQSYTLQLDTVNVLAVDKPTAVKWYQSNAMPWIAAFAVGILSVIVNLMISKSTRKTSINIAKTQLETSVRNTMAQFQGTINAKNRQDWINDVRSTLSEFLTQCKMLNIEFQENTNDHIKQKGMHEKLSFNRTKLQLLLSGHLPLHKDLLEAMRLLIDLVDLHMLQSRHQDEGFDNFEFMQKSEKVVECGTKLLYNEWQKIQNTTFE